MAVKATELKAGDLALAAVEIQIVKLRDRANELQEQGDSPRLAADRALQELLPQVTRAAITQAKKVAASR